MSNVIKAIATAMIIILIAILIWIFVSYYKANETVGSLSSDFSSGNTNVSTLEIPSGNYVGINENNSVNNEGLIESIINNSDEKTGIDNTIETTNKSGDKVDEVINQISSGDSNNSQDKNISQSNDSGDKNSGENMPNTIVEIPGEEPNQIIISSDSKTSNQQKQEILTEIDKALQGLLEAVGKVEVVDEERLDATLSSEVVES